MTMRSYVNYHCTICQHAGYTRLSENDQPYSTSWERLDIEGMREVDSKRYVCTQCGALMERDEVDPLRDPT